jgi:hypothetical protein
MDCPSENELLYNVQYNNNTYYDCLANTLLQNKQQMCILDNEKIAVGMSVTIVFLLLIFLVLLGYYFYKRRN